MTFGFRILNLFRILDFVLRVLIILVVLLFAWDTHAGFIVQRPLYIGLTSGLVGYWSFDGPDMNATQARDASGNANHGTLTNSPRRVAGRVGQALEFDGDKILDAVYGFVILGLLTPPVQSFGFRRGFVFVTKVKA